MSIIRNSRSGQFKTDDNSLTIKSFPKGEEFISGCGHYPRYWVGLNNKYLQPINNSTWGCMSLAVNDTAIIKCELASDANGPLFGCAGSSSLCIVKDGTSIKWMKGSTVLRTVTYAAGVHLYGFINTTNGMYPYYDKDVSGTKITACDQRPLYIGGYSADSETGSASGVCITSASQTYAIKVYEVIGVLTYRISSSVTERSVTHYYAATTSSTGTTPRMFETRFHSQYYYMEVGNGTAVSGVTAASGVQNFPDNILGYGVQLLDLTTVFNSPSKDLLAVASNDGGLDIDAGFTAVGDAEGNADDQCRLTYTDGSTPVNRDFSFHFNDGSNVAIPVPTGTSVAAGYTGRGGYKDVGELRKGRKPKWSIWNDAIKFGFHVINNSGTYEMRFNIFKIISIAQNTNLATIGGKHRLQWFDGCVNKSDHIHAPKLVVNSNQVTLYIHNGAFLKCLDANATMGYPTSGNTPDDKCIFILDESVGGNVYYRIGNLAPWNYTQQELTNYGFLPKGVRLTVEFLQGSYQYLSNFGDHVLSSGYLCSGTPATTKKEYQEDGWTESLMMYGNRWYLLDYINHIFQPTEEEPYPAMWVHLNLVASIIGTSYNNVKCTRLIPDQKIILSSSYDHKIVNSSSNYRMVIDSQIAGNNKIGIVNGRASNNGLQTRYANGGSVGSYRSLVFVPFIECTIDSQSRPIPSYPATAKEYKALIELYYTKYNTATQETDYKYTATIVSCIDNAAFNTALGYVSSALTPYYNFWGDSYGTNNNSKFLQCGQLVEAISRSGDNANNAELIRCMRFAFAKGTDFGLDVNGEIDVNSTVITHIYDSASAPVILKSYRDNWDSEHLAVVDTIQQTSIPTLWVESTKPYSVMSDNIMAYKFKSYYNSGTSANPVYEEEPWTDLGNTFTNIGINVKVYKKNTSTGEFTLLGTVNVRSTGASYSVGSSGLTLEYYEGRDGEANEMFYGLDGTYTNSGFQLLQLNKNNATINAGDIFALAF